MVCRLTLFGPPRLLDEQGGVISVPSKTFALAAYLVLSGRGGLAPRASLRQFLWDTPDSKAAATNLRKFLSRVLQRQETSGFELIRSRRDHVELATSSVRIDLVEFLQLVSERSRPDLAVLCDLYCGDLLEGVEWEDADSRDWMQMQRTKLRDAFVSTVASQLEAASPDAKKMSQRIAARRLIEVDPYNETGHRALMRLFAESGEPARVHEIYKNLKQRLQLDLGVGPSGSTIDLYQSLHPAIGGAGMLARETAKPSVPAMPRQEDAEHDNVREAMYPTPISRRSGTPRITLLPPYSTGAPDYHHQLAASLVEDITIGLCRFKAMSVVAPHTASQLSQSNKKAQLKAFGIDYSIETNIQSRGDDQNLSVRLVDAHSREIIWADQYLMSPGQVARHYRDLSGRLLSTIIDKVEHAELSRYDTEQEPTAYHLYLLGQKHVRGLDLPSIRRARRAFRQAARHCRDFVPAISGLARTYQVEWLLRAHGDEELLLEAQDLATRSVEIDPDDARGYRELGVCQAYAGRFDESLETLALGEQRSPQHADLLNDFADALVHACEPALALQKIERAIDLNPLCPDQYWWAAAGANYQLENYPQAVNCISHMRDQTPALRLMAASWGMLGDREQAGTYARLTKESHPDFRIENWLSIMPFRDEATIRKYKEGLRAAGFE